MGLSEAHSYLHRIVKRITREHLPVELRYIIQAHRVTFTVARQPELGGKYRRDNGPEIRGIDGTPLKISDWRQIPSDMADLDWTVRDDTKSLRKPKTEAKYQHLICIAARHSNRLAAIHPFSNGNGRASRLLIDTILMRGGALRHRG
jgi:Fic family protein